MKYGAAFVAVRIPANDEIALQILRNEPYLISMYHLMRGSGVSIQDTWTKIWDMLELTRIDIEQILVSFVKNAEIAGGLPERAAITYEKLRAFHYNALPEAETYLNC